MQDTRIFGSHTHTSPSAQKVAQVPQGTVADTSSKTGWQPPSGYDLLGFQAGFPTSWLVLSRTQRPHQISGSQCCRASRPAEWQQLPRTHHPRPSLPVLAVRTTCTCSGSSPSFSKLRAGQAPDSKKPSVTKPSLLQLHFKTHRGICHCPWLHKWGLATAF